MFENVNIKERIKITILGIVLIFSLFILLYEEKRHALTPNNIKHVVLNYGYWAPIIFLIIYSIKSFVVFIPAGVFMLAAGLTFGTLKGGIILIIGTLLSSTIGFIFSRYFGKEYIQKRINQKTSAISDLIKSKGFLIILLLRLVPILPYDVINYASGVSKIKYKDFILATFLGTIPACFLYAFLGENILKPFTRNFNISLISVILLSLVPIIFSKKIKDSYVNIYNSLKENNLNNSIEDDKK
ncbi:TVP38/TMEM64 family protein [Caldicellulosiruptoraceae bacterium PP1]